MRGVIPLVLAVLAIEGCSSPDGENVPPSGALAVHDWAAGDVGMQALLEGTLEIRDGCVVVADTAGSVVVAAFPRTLVEWDSITGVLNFGGLEYRAGDPVWMGGGYAPSDSLAIPPVCDGLKGNGVFLVQDTSAQPWALRDSAQGADD